MRKALPRDFPQDRVVRMRWVGRRNRVALHPDIPFPANKIAIQFRSIATFESTQFLGQHGVQGVGKHRWR